MTDFVKQLKEQVNIVDVVGEYVRLRKTGSNHMGLCPFHGERSASFSVSEKKGIYHCFGCQRGGDAISFLQEIQAISFHEAVRTLANRFGVKVPPEFASRGSSGKGGSVEDKLEVYYKLNRFVAQFYHERLLSPSGQGAREYLTSRGISDATIKSAYLGYAPNEWAELYDFLAEKKAPLEKAEELGLIRRKGSGADASGRAHYDLFRDRVLFPVIDTRGRVIAFGGRALGNVEGPKYLNSSESPIFKKGNHLYGLFSAQKEIRAEDQCVIVEGFMDCLALQQAGIGHAVATLGTALTERQAAMLKRYTKNIILLFDGDSAGQEAQARAMETFLNEDVVVKGITLQDEYDPDEFVREKGAEALSSLLKDAPYLLDQQVLDAVSKAGVHAEARARAVDQILPWIAKIGSETARIYRLQNVSGLFDVKVEALERRVSEIRSALPRASSQEKVAMARPVVSVRPQPRVGGKPSEALDSMDAKLIDLLIKHPKAFADLSGREGMLNGIESEAARALAAKLLESGEVQSSDALNWTDSPALQNLLTRSLLLAEEIAAKPLNPDQESEVVQGIHDLEKKLVRRGLERRKENLRAIILKVDGAGESERYATLMSEYNELVKQLDEAKANFKEVR